MTEAEYDELRREAQAEQAEIDTAMRFDAETDAVDAANPQWFDEADEIFYDLAADAEVAAERAREGASS